MLRRLDCEKCNRKIDVMKYRNKRKRKCWMIGWRMDKGDYENINSYDNDEDFVRELCR